MTILDRPEYAFLKTHPRLGKNIILLTYGGSYAYGTNIESSDIDLRGCALNSRRDLLGTGRFEQVEDTETDTTVYAFNKLMGLLTRCNPNIIELLGCRPEHYLILTPTGQELIDRRRMFLSRQMVKSFGGFAVQERRRLEYAPPSQDAARLGKYAMHLVRIYLMGLDILEREEIVTYRGQDHELLMDIRQGKHQEGLAFRPEFWQLLDRLEERFRYAAANTALPERPDLEQIEAFQMAVNERVVLREL